MTQTSIPYLFMRGGTSRGPFFLKSDLPDDRDELSKVLISVVGSGHPLNIDGLGGGNAVTTKVAILSASQDPEIDIDYFFAQVSVEDQLVDYRPTCGNILIGVGPAAIEMGLIEPTGDVTKVRIRAVNTGSLIDAEVLTPNGKVDYAGDCKVDGVPGTAAPVALNFQKIVGSQTGQMFPTGAPMETIDGIDVSCVDVAMPMMILRASDIGLTGYETPTQIDENKELFERIENMRLIAGERMGLGDVSQSVIPKVGLLAAPRDGGNISARYLMPWACHPSLAITGSQCISACVLAPGTVAESLSEKIDTSSCVMKIEHPMGQMEVVVKFELAGDVLEFESAGVTRTARMIARGEVFIPANLLVG